MTTALFESSIPSLTQIARGKVRDIYAVDADHLLIVTSDRLSAFDVILPDPIPDKGRCSPRWRCSGSIASPTSFPTNSPASTPKVLCVPTSATRFAAVRWWSSALTPLPIEAVVRGYVIGSGWKEYQQSGSICGIALPPGLQQAARLPSPIFTPASKAEAGEHDENIRFEQAQARTAELLASQLAATGVRPRISLRRHATRRSGYTARLPNMPPGGASSSPTRSSSSASTLRAGCIS